MTRVQFLRNWSQTRVLLKNLKTIRSQLESLLQRTDLTQVLSNSNWIILKQEKTRVQNFHLSFTLLSTQLFASEVNWELIVLFSLFGSKINKVIIG